MRYRPMLSGSHGVVSEDGEPTAAGTADTSVSAEIRSGPELLSGDHALVSSLSGKRCLLVPEEAKTVVAKIKLRIGRTYDAVNSQRAGIAVELAQGSISETRLSNCSELSLVRETG
jgi:hypothetical protein